jgi:hypothetical protein
MKKILIISILSLFFKQNDAFATIQKTPEKIVPLQKLSFKQRLFTYLIQRKMRCLNAKQPMRFVQNGKDLQDYMTITLKNGSIILATIISMDDKNITYKRCEQSNTAQETVGLEQVAQVTDAQNRMIFNNLPKMLKAGELTRGDKNATVSIWALVAAFVAFLLTTIFAFASARDREGGASALISGFLLTFVIGIVVSFITGIISWVQTTTTPPQKEFSKFSAILSTLISGLCIVLMLLTLRL